MVFNMTESRTTWILTRLISISVIAGEPVELTEIVATE